MDLIVVVFLVNVFNFVNGIKFDLTDSLFVVHLDLFDFGVTLVYFIPLQVHLGGVLSLHSLDFLVMFAALHIHFFVEVLLVLILLSLKRLEL